MNPPVSVIMPVRDGGPYLEAAVRSILAQTFGEFELVLVDDHSTDGAVASLDRSDPRLVVFDAEGQGVVNAFNTGLARCRGAFVARMDADDIALPERLATQLDYLDRHPQVDIAGACVEIFSETGLQGGLERYEAWLNSIRDPRQVREQIFIESPLPNPTAMFRRDALEALGGYRDVSWPEDYDLFLRADARGMQMGKPDPVLLRWREHGARITHRHDRYRRERFMQAALHYLVRHRLKEPRAVIWGAGPTGREVHDLLVADGVRVEGFIDVHPRRIGGRKRGRPVWDVGQCSEPGLPMVLVAVGAAGARQEISRHMEKHGKRPGRDYLFVA